MFVAFGVKSCLEQMNRNVKKIRFDLFLCCLLFGITNVVEGCTQINNKQEIYDISPVPSSFLVSFGLHTYGNTQLVVFYDTAHYMTIAARTLDSKVWDYQRLDSKVGWDSHNNVVVKVDAKGYIHVVGNMHVSPLHYFRSAKPLDIHSMERIPQMTGKDEELTTYPVFMNGPNGEFLFHYRHGWSGNGYEVFNVWDADRQTWSRMLDEPLLDGLGERNAYMYGPVVGPDGFFHLIWVWRETIDCATNHTLSYARSKDLIHWESIDAKEVTLPITLEEKSLWVDDTPPGGGLFNPGIRLSFDQAGKVLLGYHKYDEKMNTQLFLARYENGAWTKQQVTDWDFPWNFQGGGTVDIELHIDAPVPLGNDQIAFGYRRKDIGGKVLVLDAKTFKYVREDVYIYHFPEEINVVESTFPGMRVNLQFDTGRPADGKRYILRWETLPPNRDRKPEGELPEASMLQLYCFPVDK